MIKAEIKICWQKTGFSRPRYEFVSLTLIITYCIESGLQFIHSNFLVHSKPIRDTLCTYRREILYLLTFVVLRAIPFVVLRAIPNRPMTADCTADCTTDCLVGMAYLLGNWATGRRATAIAGRLENADLYQACLIFHRRLVARRRSSPGNQLATSRRWYQSSSGYGPLVSQTIVMATKMLTFSENLLKSMINRIT